MRILTVILLLVAIPSLSQIENVSKFIELGISPMSYKGDLSQGYQKWTSAFHIGLKRNNKEKWNGHFNLMIGSITGQNPSYSYSTTASPNLFFKTRIVSLNYDVQFNIIRKKNFILYLSQGIGLMRFTPKDEQDNNLSDRFTTRAKDETYNNITFFFPHHLGVMYFFKNGYGVGLNVGRLTPGTDYLDNISKLSDYKKADNILSFRFSVFAPISFKESPAPTE